MSKRNVKLRLSKHRYRSRNSIELTKRLRCFGRRSMTFLYRTTTESARTV